MKIARSRLARLGVLAAALLLVIVPSAEAKKKGGKKAPKGVTAGPPMDYTKIKGLSQPKYTNTITETMMMPMADGVEVYVEVIRPDAKGKFPVIAEISPYHGTIYQRDGVRMLPEQGGLVSYFVPRGYAVVMMDLRGTGRSQGCLDHMGPNDQSDAKEVIEWAATQPWSTGRVGVIGHSYPGGTSVMSIAEQPQGLVTAVVSAGLGTMYEHQWQAGVPYNLQWAGPFAGYYPLSMERHLPPGVGFPVLGSGNGGDNFGNDMEYFGCGITQTSLVTGDAILSGQYVEWHAERDFREGAAANPIPVFVIHGVNDNAARVASLDWFNRRNFSLKAKGKPVQDKLWLGQWDHGSGCCPNRRGYQWTLALHAWFDKQLQGRNVDTGPPVEIFLADGPLPAVTGGARGEIFTANSYPGDPRVVEFFPDADGTLNTTLADSAGSVSFTGDPRGFNSPAQTGAAIFRTEPFTKDTLYAGVPELDLAASVTAPRVHLIANLYDEDSSGQWRRISQFAINPELREGLDTVAPVIPGEQYLLQPPGWSMAHIMKKGHRLALRVTTSDPDKVPFFAVDPNITVFTGPDATVLRLPVIDNPVIYKDLLNLEPPATTPAVPGKARPRRTKAPKSAQPGSSASAIVPAPGAGTRQAGVTSVFVEFDVQEGFDNARMEALAVPLTSADLDLYLQKQGTDGSWSSDLGAAASGSITEETLAAGRLSPGHYRLEVHLWVGAPATMADVTLTFYDSKGNPGAV
ncbi:MAG: CocE/NonD family hydrolase [Actinomycetota bacterium]